MVYDYSDCAQARQCGGHEVWETSVLSRPKRSVDCAKVVITHHGIYYIFTSVITVCKRWPAL